MDQPIKLICTRPARVKNKRVEKGDTLELDDEQLIGQLVSSNRFEVFDPEKHSEKKAAAKTDEKK